MTFRERLLCWRQRATIARISASQVCKVTWSNLRDPSGAGEPAIARRYGQRLLDAFGFQVTVEGLEHLANLPPYAVASTHASHFDAAVLMAHFPAPVRFIAKRELSWIPVIGGHLRRRGVLIDRRKGKAALASLREAARDERPDPILIFPEGTRSRTGEIQPFRRGGLSALLEAGLVIVPVCIVGTFAAYSRHAATIREGLPLRMIICAPVRPEAFASVEAAACEVEARVRRAHDSQP